MPKKKVTVTYLCQICLDEHKNRADALQCEERGVAIPEFKRHEVVELVGSSSNKYITVSSGFNFRIQDGTKGVVHDDGGNDDKIDPHLLPAYYEVWIQTSGGPYKRELATVARKYLRKVTINDGASCPLCASSAEMAKDICSPFLTIGSGLFLFKNVPTHKCSNCCVEFFTTKQAKKVELLAKKRIKWPLADTHRLIRELEFRY